MELGEEVELLSNNVTDASPYKYGTIISIHNDAAVVLFENNAKHTVPLKLLQSRAETESGYEYSEEEETTEEELGDVNPHPWM